MRGEVNIIRAFEKQQILIDRKDHQRLQFSLLIQCDWHLIVTIAQSPCKFSSECSLPSVLKSNMVVCSWLKTQALALQGRHCMYNYIVRWNGIYLNRIWKTLRI